MSFVVKEWMKYIFWVNKLILKFSPYKFKSENIAPINFISFRGSLNIYENIKNGNISIEKVKKHQEKFKSNLNEMTRGNPKL